jgi:hypothetical protein
MLCECGNEGQVCEQCDRVFCMKCYLHYSWQATSRLCWQCQNEADKEWMNEVCKGNSKAVLRTWPRPSPKVSND